VHILSQKLKKPTSVLDNHSAGTRCDSEQLSHGSWPPPRSASTFLSDDGCRSQAVRETFKICLEIK
jgi:hypothetical protein